MGGHSSTNEVWHFHHFLFELSLAHHINVLSWFKFVKTWKNTVNSQQFQQVTKRTHHEIKNENYGKPIIFGNLEISWQNEAEDHKAYNLLFLDTQNHISLHESTLPGAAETHMHVFMNVDVIVIYESRETKYKDFLC